MSPSLSSESGLSIVETIFATVVIAIAFLGMAGVQAVSSKAHTLGKNQGLATYVSNQQLELMRRSPFADVATGTMSTTVEGIQFSITRTVTTVGSNKRVLVDTRWTDRFGPQRVQLATVVSEVTNP
jgi:Tfp pilus assembly protein PilV